MKRFVQGDSRTSHHAKPRVPTYLVELPVHSALPANRSGR
jgi:hypothetical protein